MNFKNYINLLLIVVAFLGLSACEEDFEKTIIKSDVTPNVLNAPDAPDYTFTFETNDNVFNEFSWTETDFGYQASITYTLQMDVAGNDFANAVAIGSTQDLTISPLIGDVNASLLGMGLEADVEESIEFRVMSVVSDEVASVYSNVVSANITPYLATFPPIYIIGDAQSWSLTDALEASSTGPGTYEAIGLFTENGKFRFFATPSWDAQQWGFSDFSTIPSELVSGEDSDNNFIFTGADGVYKMIVNLNTNTITLEQGELPTLYVIGDGQSWDLQQAASLTFLGGGKFEGTAVLQQDGHFRFFESPDWGATQYGYAYFEGGVPAEFTAANDNDDNFRFTGATATYNINVSLNDKTITYEVASEYPTTLYLVGDDQGWSFASSPTFKTLSEGVFEAEGVAFNQNSTFRFFEEADNWSDDYDFDYFAIVDAELGAKGDGDANFEFLAESGNYTITVSFVDKSVSVEPTAAFPSTLYLVGDDQSWSFANSPAFESQGSGVFQAKGVTFNQNSTFRFFEEADNWTDDFDYNYFTTVDSELGAKGDNDANFEFLAASGVYTITVDLSSKSVTVEAGAGYPANLYLVGDDQSWTFANSPTFTTSGDGVYEATNVTFANASTFRFFEEADNWSDDYSAGYFTGSVSSLLEAVGDNDDNFRFIGTGGTFKVTVDLANKTVDLTQ